MRKTGFKVFMAASLMSFGFVATAAEPTDAEIAAIVVAANSVDIEAGELAKKTSKNSEVKEFAERMITDHTAVNKSATELVTELKVTPKESDLSKSLQKDGKATRAKLATLKDKSFDKAYIENEIAYHQAVLDVIDKTLVPNAKNAKLKTLIENVRPAIATHLDHAKMIKTKLFPKG